ncbi:S-layer homology domain-containing protein [Desulfonispora thiosulfatigenes DSM 11270]|uniref:S-layer homology domain-containing protein n=1 Tax=Desulfonispora thiosulfatigenes DSM 11270 TaxID=656914 RepID=A0A1W1V375_DESTI|nr:S-layer homology domain-containing protein [Desulfonispora thiosulfatigenes]SMB87809.1 S-layer homology domain-containing protein [Desulfonispora thiosulfatigenes DSM 11270]
MKSKIKRNVSFLLVIMMMLSITVTGYAQDTKEIDYENHWAGDVINQWIEKGLAKGYPDSTFRPNNAVTRAEFMALVNKSFGFTAVKPIDFMDVKEKDWFFSTVKVASTAGYIAGYPDKTIRPNQPISRQEAAVIIARITKLSPNAGMVEQLSDKENIPEWSKNLVGAVVAKGYMNGYPDKSFKPLNDITRAEAVVALNNTMKAKADVTIYDQKGTYGPKDGLEVVAGDCVVKADGVILQNLQIKGNLIIAKEVGNGNATLNNIAVAGETIVRGGGENSIHINGGQYNKIKIEKTSSGKVRVVANDAKGMDIVIANEATGDDIILEGNFDSVEVEAKDVKIKTQGETQIKEIKVSVNATGNEINLSNNTKVEKMLLNAGAKIKGQGTIVKAEINAGNVTFEKQPQEQKVADTVKEQPKVTNTSSGGGGSSSGGSGGSPTPDPAKAPTITKVETTQDEITVHFSEEIKKIESPNLIEFAAGSYKFDIYQKPGIATQIPLKNYGVVGQTANSLKLVRLDIWGDLSAINCDFRLFTGDGENIIIIAQSEDFKFKAFAGAKAEVETIIIEPNEMFISVEDKTGEGHLITGLTKTDFYLFDANGNKVDFNLKKGSEVDPYLPDHEYQITALQGEFIGDYFLRFAKEGYQPCVKKIEVKISETVYDTAGTYGPNEGIEEVKGNVIMKAEGVILQNLHIKGNLIIAEEVGSGNVTLNKVTVDGDTIVRGGGENSIHINGGQYNKIKIEKTSSGKVRIVATDAKGMDIIVTEEAAGDAIILEGSFESIEVEADNVEVKTQGTTVIKKLKVSLNAENNKITLDSTTTVDNLILDAKTEVKGQGTVAKAEVNADSVTFEKAPAEQIVGENVTEQPQVVVPEVGPFTPGEGGNLPNFTPFTAEEDKIGGLYITYNQQILPFIFGNTRPYRTNVDMNFLPPSEFGADSYTLQVSDDNGVSWSNYQSNDEDLTTTTTQDNFSLESVDKDYQYRLLVNGGPKDGYTSNVVEAKLTYVKTQFSAWGLDEGMHISGIMAPNMGRGLEASFIVRDLETSENIENAADYLTYQWYRLNPVSFEMTPISGATSLQYITTEEDAGYYLLIRATGDEINVGGYAQIISTWGNLLPNKAYVSNVTTEGFTLNLYKGIDQLKIEDLNLRDLNWNDVTITSVTPGDNNAVFHIAATIDENSTPLYLSINSDFWRIVSEIEGGHMESPGVEVSLSTTTPSEEPRD